MISYFHLAIPYLKTQALLSCVSYKKDHIVSNMYFQIAESLLQSGGDLNLSDRYGHTPMHRAASKGHVKMMKLFLQYIVDVNARDVEGNTPL